MSLPIVLTCNNALAVVIGGGPVGQRKARVVATAGWPVRIVCQEPRPLDFPQTIDWLQETYQPEHLQGATLVFACAPPDVNTRVVAEAKGYGLLVNSASDPDTGNFTLPAILRDGPLTVSVSTNGAAPGLARQIRDHLQTAIDPVWSDWIRLIGALRPLILKHRTDPQERRQLFEALMDPYWLEVIRCHGLEAVVQQWLERLDPSCTAQAASL